MHPFSLKKQAGLALASYALIIATGVGVTTAVVVGADVLSNSTPLYLEAERAQLAGALVVGLDPDASGGAYIQALKDERESRAFDANDSALFCIEISEPAQYSVFANVLAPSNDANSFYVRIDYFDPWVWEIPVSENYTHEQVKDRQGNHAETYLEAGQHVVGFFSREPETRLDGVYISGGIGVSAPTACDEEDPGASTNLPAEPDPDREGGSGGDVGTSASPASSGALSSGEPSEQMASDGSGVGDPTTSTTQSAVTESAPLIRAPAGQTTTTTSQVEETTTTVLSTTSTKPKATTTTIAKATTTTIQPKSTTSTTTPADGVRVAVGQSIQAAVNANPPGTTFIIGKGVHMKQRVKPKSGNSFIGEPGAIMDGMGTTDYAFLAWEEREADRVTIRGLEIRNYNPIPAMAAITSYRSGWVVEDCEVHHSTASGVRVHDNGVIRNCVVHHNQRLGLKPSGNNILVEGNEVFANNLNGYNDPTWEAGGIKAGGKGIVFRNNHVHDNNGHGIWLDMGAINIVYEGNLIENNTYSGINHEISYDAVIRNNTIRNNGHGDSRDWLRGAGIQIKGPNVEVYGNTLSNNKNGIALIQTGRGSGPYGSYDLRNISIHDNVIINSGENGAVKSGGSNDIFTKSKFDGNTYRYQFNPQWKWNGGSGGWDFWQKQGQDLNGELE